MNLPKYQINDSVFLRESASMGFLEPAKISGVHLHTDGTWVYSIGSSSRESSPYGDRLSFVNSNVLFFSEDELILKCDALVLMEEAARNLLTSIQAQKSLLCPDSTENDN